MSDPYWKRPFWRTLRLAIAAPALLGASSPPDYHAAAAELDRIIATNYAYLDHLPGGALPSSSALVAERNAVNDRKSLLHYAEDRITSLADHHANTGNSFADSWALVPTYSDLWIVRSGNDFFIDAVCEGSPSAEAGVTTGDRLAKVDGIDVEAAIKSFWDKLGLDVTPRRAELLRAFWLPGVATEPAI